MNENTQKRKSILIKRQNWLYITLQRNAASVYDIQKLLSKKNRDKERKDKLELLRTFRQPT